MPFTFYYFGVATSSQVNVETVIGGIILGVIALIVLVIPLLGCLIYCKTRKTRYVVIQYASLNAMLVTWMLR